MPKPQEVHPYLDANGCWYYRLRNEYGRRPRFGPFRTKTDALRDGTQTLARIERARKDLRLTGLGASERRTLGDLIDRFKTIYKPRAVDTGDHHWRHLEILANSPDPSHPGKLLVARPLVQIVPADVSTFITSFPSLNVQMGWCSTWSLLIKTAVTDLRWLTPEQSPRAGIVWPHIDAARNRAIWRNLAQVRRIARFMPEPYAYLPPIQVAAGFRTCEVLVQRPSWIDWKRRIVKPEHTTARRRVSPGKKGTIPRELPLTETLDEALLEIPDDTWSDELDLCTPDWDGRILCRSMYAYYWRCAIEESGEEPVEGTNLGPYSLRTTHINWQAEAVKISAEDVAEYLGTSAAVIQEFYNRHTDERRLRNAARMDSVFREIERLN